MNSFGEQIRKLRVEKKLPLRTVASFLEIDQAILSKIERGNRKANRELVVKLAKYFAIDENDLLVSWLSDKLLVEVAKEQIGNEALRVAEERSPYSFLSKETIIGIITKISDILKTDGRVSAAWLFGSMSTFQAKADSDVDLMIEFKDNGNYSFFDLSDIAHKIEESIHFKVDLVEKGHLREFALETAQNNFTQIYG
jgi:predicted nucleotidyltransferase